jgi:hypothetical protein
MNIAHTIASRMLSSALALPFDMARERYARAVHAGLIQNSMLGARDHERLLSALERATLGPWARRV